ncbi:MAG: tripartite tricarboxylate transporter permease [Paracoccaceae bacterium]
MILETLVSGMGLYFTPSSVLLTLIGCAVGLVIGVLPGLGPLMGIILLTPVALYLPPVAGMGLLIAVFVGGSCGGAISAILLRIPGTPLAAATLLDGYPMAQKGQAAQAIGIAITASALGGLIGGVCLIFLSPLLADVAIRFGPPEYFALTLLGLISITVVSPESTVKGLMVGAVGMLVSTIGMDQFASAYRFTFGMPQMLGGFHIVAMVVGLFAISEMFMQIESGGLDRKPAVSSTRMSLSAVAMTVRRWFNLIRSSVIGIFFGALPGAGGVIASFTAYAIARVSSSEREEFGRGNPDGVVATESANNACCGGTLIPTLALGLPGDAVTAVLMGALILVGFFPGPELFENNKDVVGGIFLAYIAANIALFVLGVLLTPVFASVLKLKKKHLIPIVTLLSVIGVYAVQSSSFDLWIMFGFGVAGYFLRKHGYPVAPMVIGTVLGPICESNFRRSLVLSADDFGIFVDRPVAATILVITAVALVASLVPWARLARMRAGGTGG